MLAFSFSQYLPHFLLSRFMEAWLKSGIMRPGFLADDGTGGMGRA